MQSMPTGTSISIDDQRHMCCTSLTWSVREKLSLPAESRTTDRGMVTLAVATHRTISVAEGGLLPCMGVPACPQSCNDHTLALHTFWGLTNHTCHYGDTLLYMPLTQKTVDPHALGVDGLNSTVCPSETASRMMTDEAKEDEFYKLRPATPRITCGMQ